MFNSFNTVPDDFCYVDNDDAEYQAYCQKLSKDGHFQACLNRISSYHEQFEDFHYDSDEESEADEELDVGEQYENFRPQPNIAPTATFLAMDAKVADTISFDKVAHAVKSTQIQDPLFGDDVTTETCPVVVCDMVNNDLFTFSEANRSDHQDTTDSTFYNQLLESASLLDRLSSHERTKALDRFECWEKLLLRSVAVTDIPLCETGATNHVTRLRSGKFCYHHRDKIRIHGCRKCEGLPAEKPPEINMKRRISQRRRCLCSSQLANKASIIWSKPFREALQTLGHAIPIGDHQTYVVRRNLKRMPTSILLVPKKANALHGLDEVTSSDKPDVWESPRVRNKRKFIPPERLSHPQNTSKENSVS